MESRCTDTRPCRWDVKIVRHLEYLVGLADAPSVRPCDRGRRVFRITFARSAIHPGNQRLDFTFGERTIVRKLSVKMRIGEPRRYLAAEHRFANGFGPRPYVLVGEERHGRHFAREMTALASFPHDGQDFFVEGDCFVESDLRRGVAVAE